MPEEPVIKKRKEAQRILDTPVEKRGYEAVASGTRHQNEKIAVRVEPRTGLWNKSESGKPSRLLIHVDATDPENPVVTLSNAKLPIGAVNLKGGLGAKTLFSFRVLAMIKTADGYTAEVEWDWLLWVAIKKPASPNSTSGLVEKLNLQEGKVMVNKTEQDVVGVGLISLCPPDEEAKSLKGLRYGVVTKQLAKLITESSRPTIEVKNDA